MALLPASFGYSAFADVPPNKLSGWFWTLNRLYTDYEIRGDSSRSRAIRTPVTKYAFIISPLAVNCISIIRATLLLGCEKI